MKTKHLFSPAIVLAVALVGCATHHHETQAELQAQAKISRSEAESTALSRVPGGTIKEGELEKEHGKLIWSFDITTTNSKDITEIGVDAITGAVVSTEKETAEHEAGEKSEDDEKKKDDKL
jgi:peptidase YpeB-like protein